MKITLKYLFFSISALFFLNSCINYKRLVTDEVVLKDQNSQTGTIIESDTAKLKLKHLDESVNVIKWTDVDTVIGKKLKTVFVGANFGYYNIPYFSVLRNESRSGYGAGYQYKVGYAFRSNSLYYLSFLYSPAKPYTINKVGVGYQRYLGASTYLRKRAFFIGGEFNMMNVEHNNGAQACFEPFTGYELKLAAHVRVHFKFAIQFNIANKNSGLGSNLSMGFHFMRKNFTKRYNYLNTQHRIYGQ